MAVRFAVGAKGSQTQKPPPGPPHPPPSQCFPASLPTVVPHDPIFPAISRLSCRQVTAFPAHFCPLLPGIARNFPAPFYCLPAHDCAVLRGIARLKILPLSKCPRTVRRSRSASRRAPFAAAPVALRAASAATNAKGTHAEKGECSILHEQGNFLYCVDKREELVAAG